MAIVFKDNLSYEEMLQERLETESKRIGARIRKYRLIKELSQAELGALIGEDGLTADRVQKYENGQRKPGKDMLIKIASALEVSPLALSDSTPCDLINTMYVLFELEDNYGVDIKYSGDYYVIRFKKDTDIYESLKLWELEKIKKNSRYLNTSNPQEKKEAVKDYEFWKATFPKRLSDLDTIKKRQEEIRNQIKSYKAELSTLDNMIELINAEKKNE